MYSMIINTAKNATHSPRIQKIGTHLSIIPPLLEKTAHPLHRVRGNLVALGKLAFERLRCVDHRDRVAEPAAEALHFAHDLNVLVPVRPGADRPHDFALVEDVDVVVDHDA